jgi:hypothetical protein
VALSILDMYEPIFIPLFVTPFVPLFAWSNLARECPEEQTKRFTRRFASLFLLSKLIVTDHCHKLNFVAKVHFCGPASHNSLRSHLG